MSDDLISRSALKKAFENLTSDDYNESIWYQKTVFETIDNAPTVDTTFREVVAYACGQKSVERPQDDDLDILIKKFQQVFDCAFAIGYEKGMEERPQGEWQLHGMIYYCSECGHECSESGDNFCGNCGADMRGGNE